MDNSIGDRVARLIPRGEQGRVAAAVGMTPDALSRAIHGQRGFGAAELMRIADHFDADLHTLISGEPDPRRPRLVARHDYDQSTRTRSIPGHSADRPILDDITLAYRQALLAPRCRGRDGVPRPTRHSRGDELAHLGDGGDGVNVVAEWSVDE